MKKHTQNLLAFLVIALFSLTSLQAVNLSFDGTIEKLNGDMNNATCNAGDKFLLGLDMDSINGQEIAVILTVGNIKNGVHGLIGDSSAFPKRPCIGFTKTIPDSSDNTNLKFIIRNTKEFLNNMEGEDAYMQLIFRIVEKNNHENPVFLDNIIFTAFDLDTSDSHARTSNRDTVYLNGSITIDSDVPIGENYLNAQEAVDYPQEDFNGYLRRMLGQKSSCAGNRPEKQQLCKAAGSFANINQFSFMIHNKNAFGGSESNRSYRLFEMSFNEADAPLGIDSGDAPESYGEALSAASFTYGLGELSRTDGESPRYSVNADADDIDGSDDDDGVSIDGKTIDGSTFTLTKGYTYDFDIITHGNGYLNAWMDHDAGGSFDSGEEHFINEHRPDANSSTNLISVTIPQTTTVGTTYMRFRYSDKSGTTPTGRDASSFGEVEDYKVIIQDSGGVYGKVYNDKNANGTQDADENGIAGVKVRIVAANGEDQEVDTNANGEYSFTGVALGDATVTITENTVLEHSIKTTGTTNPTQVTVVADENTLEENNGYQYQANLVTTKTVDNAAPQVGANIKYTLTVTNNGPVSATNVSLTDELPSGVTFQSANTAEGSYDESTGVWSIGTLTNGQTATLELVASVDASSGGQEITNTTTAAESPDTGDSTAEGDDLSAKINVDVIPGLSISDASITEGGKLSFTVTLAQASNLVTKIKFNTLDGTGNTGAKSPDDYTPLVDHVVTIEAGTTEAIVKVSTEDDHDVEETETFTLNGVVTEGQTENPNISATGTIIDNDGDAAVGNISNDSVSEGETLSHVVTMNASASTAKTYNFSFENNGDINASDYNFDACVGDVTCDINAGTITVAPYTTTFTIKVKSKSDPIYEGVESYTVKVGDKEAIGEIRDLTEPEIASISDANATEGQVLTHTVTMSGASSSAGIFPFEIEDRETTAGEDYSTTYSFSNGVTYDGALITVPAEVTTFDVSVTSKTDDISDNGETYTISIKDKTAIGTIIDIETPTVSISNASVVEGGILTFNVSLSMKSTENIVLTFSEDESSTATLSKDYKSFSGTYWVIIPPNTLNAEFTIETINDEIKEDVEEYIDLTANVAAGQTSNEYVTARGTILDDDNDVGVGSIEDAFALEGQPLYHRVIMSGISDLEERYDFNIENLTTSDDDYNAAPTFSQNVTYDGDQIIVPRHTSEFYVIIQSTVDTEYEPDDESYNISIEDKEAIGTIHDYIKPAVLRDDNETHKIKDDDLPDTINILENDDSGVIASTVRLYSNVPGTEGNGTKELVVPNEGTWSINATGTLLFVPLISSINEDFQPTEITYNAVDDNGYRLDSAIARIVYDDDWDP